MKSPRPLTAIPLTSTHLCKACSLFSAPAAMRNQISNDASFNQARGGAAGNSVGRGTGGSGGQGLGGGVYNAGATLTPSQVTVRVNEARGGSGGERGSTGFFNAGSGGN